MIKTKTTQNKRVDKILRTNSYDLIIKIFKRLFKKKINIPKLFRESNI
jgi:hypothetical protein